MSTDHHIRMRLAILSGALAVSSAVSAQTPRDLAQAAIDRLHAADSTRTRFTDIRVSHTVNTESDGAVTYNALEKFEETWINNLPYLRLLELNGKPLTGRTLREEQQRYDLAVSGRQPLGTTERIRLANSEPVTLGTVPADALAPGFNFREIRTDASPGGPVHLLEATGIPFKPGLCRWRYQFWISGNLLTRYRVDVPDDPPPPDSCRGSYQDVTWQLVDGVPVKSHDRSHMYLYERGDRIIVDGETTYSNYRRFAATVTIGPANVPVTESSPH